MDNIQPAISYLYDRNGHPGIVNLKFHNSAAEAVDYVYNILPRYFGDSETLDPKPTLKLKDIFRIGQDDAYFVVRSLSEDEVFTYATWGNDATISLVEDDLAVIASPL